MPRSRRAPGSLWFRAAALVALAMPGALTAQRPRISAPLARAMSSGRDTSFTVWFFMRADVSLAEAAQRLRSAGAIPRTSSRWLHAVSASVPAQTLVALGRERWIGRVQPLGRWRRVQPPSGIDEWAVRVGDTCAAGGDPSYGPSAMPYRQLHLRPLTDAGVNGSGVRIAILDAGFNTQDPTFAGVTVTAQHDFVFGDSVVRDEPNDQPGAQFHGTAVWSLFAGLVPGRLVGIARGASYLLAKTEDIRSETRVEEDNYVAALEWADSIGVDIVSSSLGYLSFDNGFSYTPSQLNGDVAVTSVAADSAAAHGILVVTAAGNQGPGFRTLDTPGDARAVITAGAEDSLGTITGFSSRGPTADGRLKPDLTAPGLDVCTDAGGSLGRLAGTSFATPLLAASAALMKQLQPTLGPLALRDALRAQGSHHAAPDSTYGWGRPDVTAAATFAGGVTPLAPLPPALASITPDFAWSAGAIPGFAQPVTYRLRIARDSTFTTTVVDTQLSVAQYPLRRPQKPGAPLFWRVEAVSATAESASTGVVGPIAVPAWARLTSLADTGGSATPDTQPTFTWSPTAIASPPGPLHYDVFVFRTNLPIPTFGAGGLTDTVFQIPRPLQRNATYRWELIVHAGADTSRIAAPRPFVILDVGAPPATILYQNFPNPFPSATQAATCIWFDLATPSQVELDVLTLRGGVVRHVLPNASVPAILAPGRYGRGTTGGNLCDERFTWDGRADDGEWLPAGVYLYKLKVGGLIQFKRLVYLGRTH
ncbi:MAG TPA: S8 family serine peptidase [Gemmatimonadales bacterium]|nr:S8 family serine peptidase [Gemmatimonadales bacterium]